MIENLKYYLYVVFSKLSFDKRREIIAYLKDMNLNSDTGFKDTIDEIREKRYSNGFFCPHCESKKVVRFGCYRSRLKIWMNIFKGVATKYLSNYLHWFEFIDSIGKDKIQKAAEIDLLFRACSVKAV